MSLKENPIFITGLPRSGTSMIAGIFSELGVFFGNTVPGGSSNPKGFFEHIAIRENIAKGILKAGNFCPLGVRSLPPENWAADVNFGEVGLGLNVIIKRIIESEGLTKNKYWAYKDAKLTLMWKIFDRSFPDATWIIVRRDRENFIKSCLKTPFMLQHSSDERFWHNFADQYEKRLLSLEKSVNLSYEVNSAEVASGRYDAINKIRSALGVSSNKKVIENFIDTRYWNTSSVINFNTNLPKNIG